MEFFDIFNNVKSGLKIILCQPNKVVFKVKVLSLRCLYPYRKPQMGRGWADIHMVKGVFIRFGFDAIRISQIQRQVKNKATRNVSWVYCIQSSLASDDSIVCCQERFLYTYTGVGLSALLVSTDRAMRRHTNRGTSDRTGSTFFVYIQ